MKYRQNFWHIFSIVLCSLLYSFFQPVSASKPYSDIRIITGYLPPWSMQPNKSQPGFYIEIMNEAQKRLGLDIPIETIPWSRAQEIAQKSANVIIFPMSRIESREGKYIWLNRINPLLMLFASFRNETLTLEKAKFLNRILVHQNAPPETILRRQGFTNLARLHDIHLTIPKMLKIGRADAWFTPKDMADWVWKLNPDMPLPKYSYILSGADQYISTSKEFDNKLRMDLYRTLNNMHADGTISKIIANYSR